MKALLEHFQIVLLLGGALFFWMKKRLEESRQREAFEAWREEASGEAEDVEALESQGAPWAMGPPPLPLSLPPPRREFGYEAAAAEEQAKALKHQLDLAAHLRLLLDTKATTTGGAAATRARVAAKGKGATPAAAALPSLRQTLRDPAAVRRAFALREILDPPLSLR
jgi:hypothetical protein